MNTLLLKNIVNLAHHLNGICGAPFLERYARVIAHCAYALKPGGKLAILIGDYGDRDASFVPLTYHTKRLAFESGLIQTCSRKVYRSAFIPGLHDVCAVFTK